MLKINRRTFAAGSTALALSPRLAGAQGNKQLLRFVQNGNLTILDPIWTTAYVTRDHGYMIYDTLFSTDEAGAIKPQMVDKYEVSPDKTPGPSPCATAWNGTTASRSWPRIASPRSSAGAHATRWARS